MESSGVHWSPLESTGVQFTPVGLYGDGKSTWTPTGLSSPVDSTPLHSTLIIDDMGGLGCRESPLESIWSPVESSGVHMDYGGDRQDLPFALTFFAFEESDIVE